MIYSGDIVVTHNLLLINVNPSRYTLPNLHTFAFNVYLK